jgi:hypothetical protein
MKLKAHNHLARILKAEGIPWVSLFPTCGVNNALGEEGIPMLMMRDERYAVAVADAFCSHGEEDRVCTVMGLNAAGIHTVVWLPGLRRLLAASDYHRRGCGR